MHISQPFRFSQDQSSDLSLYTESFSIFRMPVHASMLLAIKNIAVSNHITAAGGVFATPVSLAIIRADDLDNIIKTWSQIGVDIRVGIDQNVQPIDDRWMPPDSPIVITEPQIVVIYENPAPLWNNVSALSLIQASHLVTTVSAQSTVNIPSEVLDSDRAQQLYLIPYVDGLRSQPIVAAGRITFDLLYLGADGTVFYGDE